MERDDLIAELREAGFHEEARRIASVTPTQEAAFEAWLANPENRRRWDEALASVSEEVGER